MFVFRARERATVLLAAAGCTVECVPWLAAGTYSLVEVECSPLFGFGFDSELQYVQYKRWYQY